MVWKLGLFLIQSRLRNVCDIMMEQEVSKAASTGLLPQPRELAGASPSCLMAPPSRALDVARASRVAFTSKCACSHLLVVASASLFANASKSTCYHFLVVATDGSSAMPLPEPGACIADRGLLFRYARFRSSSSQGLAEAAFPCPARTRPDLQSRVGGICGKKPGRHGLTN